MRIREDKQSCRPAPGPKVFTLSQNSWLVLDAAKHRRSMRMPCGALTTGSLCMAGAPRPHLAFSDIRQISLSCRPIPALACGMPNLGNEVRGDRIGIPRAGAGATALFSRSDGELDEQGLEVHTAVDDLDLDQLNTLFVRVGFPRRQKEKLAKALDHTLALVWLRELRSKQLVAFARATGDHVFNAVIWDVVVDPSYQGIGLGKVVMERLMSQLLARGISNIALYAEPNVVSFYKPLGFVPDPDGIRAMAYSRRPR